MNNFSVKFMQYTILYIPKMRRTRRSIVMFKYDLACRFFRAQEVIRFALLGIRFFIGSPRLKFLLPRPLLQKKNQRF